MRLATSYKLPSVALTKKNAEFPVCPKFDFEKGEFVLDSTGNIAMESPEDSAISWVIKTISHLRYSKLGYSNAFGIESDKLKIYSSKSAKESWIKRTINDAVIADPKKRILKADNFTFDYTSPDSVIVNFTVLLDSGVVRVIEKEIHYG